MFVLTMTASCAHEVLPTGFDLSDCFADLQYLSASTAVEIREDMAVELDAALASAATRISRQFDVKEQLKIWRLA